MTDMIYIEDGPSEISQFEYEAMSNHERREYVAKAHKQVIEVPWTVYRHGRQQLGSMFVMRLVATGWYFGKGATPDECRADYELKLARMIVDA